MRHIAHQNHLLVIQDKFTIKMLNENSGIWEHIHKCDIYYARHIVMPGSNDIYVVGGARDIESEFVTNETLLMRNKT